MNDCIDIFIQEKWAIRNKYAKFMCLCEVWGSMCYSTTINFMQLWKREADKFLSMQNKKIYKKNSIFVSKKDVIRKKKYKLAEDE